MKQNGIQNILESRVKLLQILSETKNKNKKSDGKFPIKKFQSAEEGKQIYF
jgi:hypothetical protein